MAFPPGVVTTTLTFGSSLRFDGTDVETSIEVTPSTSVVWAATGQPLVDFPLTATASPGMPGSLAVPVVDQDGWHNMNGEAFTMWAYTVRMTWTAGGQRRTATKAIQPLTSQAQVDLDMVPGGNVTLAVSAPIPPVISVNGQTGAVVVEGGGGGVESWAEIEALPDTPELATIADVAAVAAAIPTTAADVGAVPTTRTVAGKALSANVTLVKGDVGLGNVDNTSDASKPISTATQAALDAKAPTASPTFTGTVSGVTKAHVGLSNVDNTSDANKPVSTAQQAALDAKAPIASPTFTGTVSGVTKTHVGLGNVDNIRQLPLTASRPVIRATALNTFPTKASLGLTGYTGNYEYDHLAYGAVTVPPADIAAGDIVTDVAP